MQSFLQHKISVNYFTSPNTNIQQLQAIQNGYSNVKFLETPEQNLDDLYTQPLTNLIPCQNKTECEFRTYSFLPLTDETNIYQKYMLTAFPFEWEGKYYQIQLPDQNIIMTKGEKFYKNNDLSSICMTEMTEEKQCKPCYAIKNLDEIKSNCLTSLRKDTFQNQLLNCNFHNYTENFEPQLLKADYNNWIYAMDHKGKLTTKCNDTVLIEELPSTGIVTFPDESDCDFSITNGPFTTISEMLPSLKIELKTESLEIETAITETEIRYWYSTFVKHVKENIVYYGIGLASLTIIMCMCTICISAFTIIIYRNNTVPRQPIRPRRQNNRNERHQRIQNDLLDTSEIIPLTTAPMQSATRATNSPLALTLYPNWLD